MALFSLVPGARRSLDRLELGMLDQMGRQAKAVARRLVHVKTGQTRDSTDYIVRPSDKAMQLYADTPWAIYLEYKYPFLRPALASLRGFKLNSVNLELGFQSAAGTIPPHRSRASVKAGRGVIRRTKVVVRKYSPHRPLS